MDGLEFTMWIRMALNTQSSAYLCFLGVWNKGMCHQAWLQILFNNYNSMAAFVCKLVICQYPKPDPTVTLILSLTFWGFSCFMATIAIFILCLFEKSGSLHYIWPSSTHTEMSDNSQWYPIILHKTDLNIFNVKI